MAFSGAFSVNFSAHVILSHSCKQRGGGGGDAGGDGDEGGEGVSSCFLDSTTPSGIATTRTTKQIVPQHTAQNFQSLLAFRLTLR